MGVSQSVSPSFSWSCCNNAHALFMLLLLLPQLFFVFIIALRCLLHSVLMTLVKKKRDYLCVFFSTFLLSFFFFFCNMLFWFLCSLLMLFVVSIQHLSYDAFSYQKILCIFCALCWFEKAWCWCCNNGQHKWRITAASLDALYFRWIVMKWWWL